MNMNMGLGRPVLQFSYHQTYMKAKKRKIPYTPLVGRAAGDGRGRVGARTVGSRSGLADRGYARTRFPPRGQTRIVRVPMMASPTP